MTYLTIDELKKQCNIDPQYDGDNEYLEMLSVVANEPERIMRERFKWLREKSLTMWQEFAERNRN